MPEGIELSVEAASYAKDKLGLPVRVGDASTLVNLEGSLDAIVILDLIEHLVDPELILRACGAKIRQGGLLVLRTPDAASGAARAQGKYWAQITPPEHLTLFSRKGLFEVLRRNGLTPVTWRRAGGLGLWSMVNRSKKSQAGERRQRLKVSYNPLVYNLTRLFGRPFDRGDMMELISIRQ